MSNKEIYNIRYNWTDAKEYVDFLEGLFKRTGCEYRVEKDYKSDEGMLKIKSCTCKNHPYAKGQHIPKCTIELCPTCKGD